MKVDGPFPFRGEVIWLTADQGGRRSGPPPDPSGYAHLAHVPPATVESGTASFVLRGFDPHLWRSRAEGRWLLVDKSYGDVEPGSVIAVTEGTRLVAFFVVAEVDPDGLAAIDVHEFRTCGRSGQKPTQRA